MPRVIRVGLVVLLVVVVCLAVLFAYVSFTRFFRFQAAVDRIYRAIPPEEHHVSPAARKVFATLVPESRVTYSASVGLLSDVAPARVRMGEWHLRNGLWVWLLPRRFTNDERFVIFVHYLPFEGGFGVRYGARKYFGKMPSELTEDDALKLFVISGAPRVFSPSQHPERFGERLQYVTRRYRGAV